MNIEAPKVLSDKEYQNTIVELLIAKMTEKSVGQGEGFVPLDVNQCEMMGTICSRGEIENPNSLVSCAIRKHVEKEKNLSVLVLKNEKYNVCVVAVSRLAMFP